MMRTKAFIQNLYNTYDTENGGDYDVQFFSYDWRCSVADGAEALEDYIDSQDYSSVILVCHSMGGLIASQYINASDANAEKVDKLITIGTPYLGAPKALNVLETGSFLSGTKGAFTKNFFKTATQNLPTVYELLPSEEYLDSNTILYNYIASGYSKNKAEYTTDETHAFINNYYTEALYTDAIQITDSLAAANAVDQVDSYVIYGTGQHTISSLSVAELLGTSSVMSTDVTDGDGYDTLCIRRGNHYYINNTLEGGNAAIDFTFGREGDEVYAGMWQ